MKNIHISHAACRNLERIHESGNAFVNTFAFPSKLVAPREYDRVKSQKAEGKELAGDGGPDPRNISVEKTR